MQQARGFRKIKVEFCGDQRRFKPARPVQTHNRLPYAGLPETRTDPGCRNAAIVQFEAAAQLLHIKTHIRKGHMHIIKTAVTADNGACQRIGNTKKLCRQGNRADFPAVYVFSRYC